MSENIHICILAFVLEDNLPWYLFILTCLIWKMYKMANTCGPTPFLVFQNSNKIMFALKH